ncbi:hypothetical protein BT93_L4047 [Corymbia citriodora subsp. variegata]|uniref:Uncharacterized protein n=1 Tax=Corymbia citriodora subsp. variegata TaxID=360336 RepID=A0A8T0CYF5_CORYI|nr:hypothetical protein BT93_L4047 [Corymbia citriodora subsp. variegata]
MTINGHFHEALLSSASLIRLPFSTLTNSSRDPTWPLFFDPTQIPFPLP